MMFKRHLCILRGKIKKHSCLCISQTQIHHRKFQTDSIQHIVKVIEDLPLQSGPNVPEGQHTLMVSMQNHLKRSGYLVLLKHITYYFNIMTDEALYGG